MESLETASTAHWKSIPARVANEAALLFYLGLAWLKAAGAVIAAATGTRTHRPRSGELSFLTHP